MTLDLPRKLISRASLALALAWIAAPTLADDWSIDYTLPNTKTHDKFSSAIPPVLTVPSGSVIEAYTHEFTGGQITKDSKVANFEALDHSKIHTITGPVFVERARPGDVLAVELLELESMGWGWNVVGPGWGNLRDDAMFTGWHFRVFDIDKEKQSFKFRDDIEIPLRLFPGVMGVAPPTEDMLSTIPPRANGGNMDDPNMVEGVTVYFPVFVPGALFSIGDPHAAQGLGEVSGAALEAPMRIVYRISVIKNGRKIEEPQYETDEYYATTGFAPSVDEAQRKATRYMIDYVMAEHELSRADAYMLLSFAGDLLIAETVDYPHMLVTMHLPKSIFKQAGL